MKLALFILAASVFTSGCKEPKFESGTIECGASGCPSGMECGTDGFCWRSGSGPDLDSSSVDGSSQAAALPTGAVVFFRTEVCPDGFKELETARGRGIVGAAPSAVIGQQVGAALENLGKREISTVPAHLHSVALGNVTSATTSHSHTKTSHDGHDATGGGTNPQEVTDTDSTITVDSNTHGHSVNIPEFQSDAAGSATVDVTMPYLQLLACVKE